MTDNLTADQVQRIVAEAVKSTLESLGIDTTNKIETQADFATMRAICEKWNEPGFQEDLAFAGKLRVNTKIATETSLKHVITIVVTGLVGLIVIGSKDWWLGIMHMSGKP